MIGERWGRLAAAGGRLLGEYCECERPHYAQHGVYRLDYPSGGRVYLAEACWVRAWVDAGRPAQPLLAGAGP